MMIITGSSISEGSCCAVLVRYVPASILLVPAVLSTGIEWRFMMVYQLFIIYGEQFTQECTHLKWNWRNELPQCCLELMLSNALGEASQAPSHLLVCPYFLTLAILLKPVMWQCCDLMNLWYVCPYLHVCFAELDISCSAHAVMACQTHTNVYMIVYFISISDRDDCKLSAFTCQYSCNYTQGSYRCVCPSGMYAPEYRKYRCYGELPLNIVYICDTYIYCAHTCTLCRGNVHLIPWT